MAEGDDLYQLEPEAFTAARNALVKRLRAEQRKDEAAAVARLRRPTPSAWALDAVARSTPKVIEAALAAGGRLRAATEAAVGGDASGLRRATAEERAAVDAAVDAAAERLGNRAASLRPQLAATLRAAAVDEAIAESLRQGVLATDHDAPGFGFDGFEGIEAGPPPAPRRGAEAKAASNEEAKAAAAAEREQRRRRAHQEEEAHRLAKRAERLAATADRLEGDARRARVEADEAVAEADAAARELT